MASTPSAIDLTTLEASPEPSESSSTLPNAFRQMMQQQPVLQKKVVRDLCRRLSPTYNFNYNPYEPPNDDLLKDYLLYVFGKPLYNNREVIMLKLL